MDWPYQYDIGFQYSYGSVTLLFLMALLSIDQLSKNQLASDNVLVALLASSIIFSSAILYSFTHNWNFEIQYYQTRKDYFDGLEKTLQAIRRVFAAMKNCMIFSTIITKSLILRLT